MSCFCVFIHPVLHYAGRFTVVFGLLPLSFFSTPILLYWFSVTRVGYAVYFEVLGRAEFGSVSDRLEGNGTEYARQFPDNCEECMLASADYCQPAFMGGRLDDNNAISLLSFTWSLIRFPVNC